MERLADYVDTGTTIFDIVSRYPLSPKMFSHTEYEIGSFIATCGCVCLTSTARPVQPAPSVSSRRRAECSRAIHAHLQIKVSPACPAMNGERCTVKGDLESERLKNCG